MRQDNRGFTLVELIIAIAMASIVLAAAITFLGSSEKNYRVAEETIDLQMESQIFMEQMANWVMECNSIKVDSVSGGAGGSSVVNGDVLFLYNIPRNNGKTEEIYGGSDVTDGSRRVIWCSGNKLYMVEETGLTNAALHSVPEEAFFVDHSEPENCVAAHIFQFIPAQALGTNPRKVSIQLWMQYESQTYQMENEFSLRNEYVPLTVSALDPGTVFGGDALPRAAEWKGGCCNA